LKGALNFTKQNMLNNALIKGFHAWLAVINHLKVVERKLFQKDFIVQNANTIFA
jgi:hypothetical protein